MLSMKHRLEFPAERPRTYGSWNDFIEPLAEVTATRMLAALERRDAPEIERQAVFCRSMGEMSQEIVDQLRFERTN